jgi:hypothetical protein
MLSILHLFGKQVGNVSFAINVTDVDVAQDLHLAYTEFLHIDMPKFLGYRDTLCPVNAPAVVVPYWSGQSPV